jgi:hypothetical protein
MASLKDGRTAITLINRHFDQPASVSLIAPSTRVVDKAYLLSADHPRAANSAERPDLVKPVPLQVDADGAERWRIELPPHSITTVQFS